MDGRISMLYVLLVCVWCSLDAGGFLMVVTAQPTVSVMILTPEADRKEGGQVDMKCTVTNLELDQTVEWRTEGQTLRWGEATVWDVNGRFIFDTSVDLVTQTVVQDFTIPNVQRADTDEYVCNVNDPIPTGGSRIVATSNVTLLVFYFPSESFPMCSPAGPITVDAETELDMTCSSKSSHGTVTMTINSTIQTARYTTWTSVISHDNDTVVSTLDLRVDDAVNGVAFDCAITSVYFTAVQRSCQIGPIKVTELTPTPDRSLTTDSSSPITPLTLALVVIFCAVTFIAVIIILILRDVRKNRLIKNLKAEKEYQDTKRVPYTELQSMEDQNRVYMEPATAKETTTTQGTHYQPVEVENESPE